MRTISHKALVEFGTKHKGAKRPLSNWYRVVKASTWNTPEDVKRTLAAVDQPRVSGKLIAIFNVGGNKYRIIAVIQVNVKRVYIRSVLTHAEYSTGKWKAKI